MIQLANTSESYIATYTSLKIVLLTHIHIKSEYGFATWSGAWLSNTVMFIRDF